MLSLTKHSKIRYHLCFSYKQALHLLLVTNHQLQHPPIHQIARNENGIFQHSAQGG